MKRALYFMKRALYGALYYIRKAHATHLKHQDR